MDHSALETEFLIWVKLTCISFVHSKVVSFNNNS
uniref:Uncharacterized protein n=1 Tax=Lepeophtheirus salmonis TaxID=72036 RepID=A0A0K2VDV2_LEPSM